MERLVVRLGASSQDTIYWVVWSDQEDEIIASGELTNAEQLSTLKDRAGQRPITVLVPASELLLKWVTLPPKAARKALAAIPFMLEEDISGDINDQFFAIGPKVGEQQGVAVINREKLHTWIALIEQAGLHCNLMLPDVLALPEAEQGWSILELGEQLLVRQDQWLGLQGECQWLLPAIQHQANRQHAEEGTPLHISSYSALDLSTMTNIDMSSMPLDLPIKLLAQGAQQANFNLLQGEFKPKNTTTTDWKKWRVAAVLAVLLFATTLVDNALEINRIDTQLAQLKQQIDQEYKRAFPNAGAYRNLKKTMQRKIRELEQGSGGGSVLGMMAQLQPAFRVSQIKPQTLRFDSQRSELRIQAVAQNFDALDAFKGLAEEQGFTVQQGAINQKNNQVIGTLSIKN